MVLLEIDTTGLAILEFKGNAPWSVHVDRIAPWVEPVQRMKIEAWDVHFLSSNGDIETVEARKNALVHLRVDLRTLARGPLRKGFAFEGADHIVNVSN
jgi:hypothetical protein